MSQYAGIWLQSMNQSMPTWPIQKQPIIFFGQKVLMDIANDERVHAR
jgi:hypothetical protein